MLYKTLPKLCGVNNSCQIDRQCSHAEEAHRARNCNRPLGLEQSFQEIVSRSQNPQSCSCKERPFENNLNEPGSEFLKLPDVPAAHI